MVRLWNGKIKCLFRGTNITVWHMCWGSCHCVTVKIETRKGFAETSAGSYDENIRQGQEHGHDGAVGDIWRGR